MGPWRELPFHQDGILLPIVFLIKHLLLGMHCFAFWFSLFSEGILFLSSHPRLDVGKLMHRKAIGEGTLVHVLCFLVALQCSALIQWWSPVQFLSIMNEVYQYVAHPSGLWVVIPTPMMKFIVACLDVLLILDTNFNSSLGCLSTAVSPQDNGNSWAWHMICRLWASGLYLKPMLLDTVICLCSSAPMPWWTW